MPANRILSTAADVGAAPAVHTHAQADVTNLVTDLTAKATAADLTAETTARTAADLLAAYWRPPAMSWFPYVVRRNSTTGAPEVALSAAGAVLDVATLAPATGVTYFVGYGSTSDGNSGLDTAHALTNLTTALAKPDVGRVFLYPKLYARAQGTFPAGTGRSVSIIASTDGVTPGGTAILSAHDVLTWSLQTGSTYKATRSAVLNVWDSKTPDSRGDNVRLTAQASIAAVDANPGSYYFDSGTNTIYVRTADSRSLVGDTQIRVYLDVKNAVVTAPVTVYLEGLSCEGGDYALQVMNAGAGAVPTCIAKNCAFKYGGKTNANTVTVQGANTVFANCVAAQSYLDGFNYHSLNGVLCQSIEIGCTGRDNGWGGGDANNGSTTHDGQTIVRVGGQYLRNDGPNVVDVDSGTTSWNVGVFAAGSTAATGAQQNTNYMSQASGAGGQWLVACSGYADPATATKYQLVATSGGRLYHTAFTGSPNVYIDSTSLIAPF